SDLPRLRSEGFFHGYSPLVAAVVVNHALGGLVVALVVKYADNLVKGFAVSLSIIISAAIFVIFYGNSVTVFLVVGGFLVLLSSWMYSQPDAPTVTQERSVELTTTQERSNTQQRAAHA